MTSITTSQMGAKRPKCVVIGGGSGTSPVLQGLKSYPVDLTAIVTMADDGGSSGRLRDQFGLLPPGDVRRCLVALSADEQVDQTMRSLFQYRFEQGDGLNGHSFGNLMLTALAEIVGSLEEAIVAASRLLNVRGTVLPVTTSDVRLGARLEDGSTLWGESNIDVRKENPEISIDRMFLSKEAVAYPPALEAIRQADVIVIGPGDLYTSLIPNLLVKGIPEAIASSNARQIYICNLMTKHGETDDFTASSFVSEVLLYMSPAELDSVIVNTAPISRVDRKRYAKEQAEPVIADLDRCREFVAHVVGCDLANPELIRHDSKKLATAILKTAGLSELVSSIHSGRPVEMLEEAGSGVRSKKVEVK